MFTQRLCNFLRKFKSNMKGSILMFALVFGSVAFMVITLGVSSYAMFENKASLRKHDRDIAFHIAEAGINYYRWHLAHNQTDYQDGTGQPGPYVHSFDDKDGQVIGYYSLTIIPPLSGSTVVTVQSTGWAAWQPDSKRTIKVRMGAPALTDYTFLSNAGLNFSFTTVVHGPVHSNNDIRFDGTTDSWVKSHTKIQGGGGPKTFWKYPVPEVDFFGVTTDLDSIRKLSDVPGQGLHLTSSGVEGYHLVFNGNQFALYKVTSRDCYNGEGSWKHKWSGWYWNGSTYCYDIKTENFVQNYSIPANGAIFIEDDTWVEGTVNGRVSIGVGKFPVQAPYKKIYINNNLIYAAKASDDVIGLLCQGDIVVPYETPNVMEINAALLSQFGKNYRPYYDSNLKDTLRIFGSQIAYEGGGWKYVNGWGNVISGYVNTDHSYDANLRYFPPPGFPVGTTYELISWEEVE